MDEDLEKLNRDALIAEARRLRAGIRAPYRDSLDRQLPDVPRTGEEYDGGTDSS